MPFFSVVIPLYNKEDHIQKTLESVLAQSFSDFEIILVDDGSTDASMKRAKSVVDTRIKYFSQENSGASQARNYGIEQASAEHIALLDADDIWEKNHLEEHHKSIKKFPEAALYCNAYKVKLVGGFSHDAVYNLPKKDEIVIVADYFDASMIHPIANANAVTFKKTEFLDIGGFNANIPCSEDIDLWIRFALRKKVVFNPAITNSYDKTVEKSLSKSNYRKNEYQLFNSYKEEEKTNSSLKKYMDLNRYSLAIQCKYFQDEPILKKLKKEISPTSLNWKQRLLLYSPSYLAKWFKQLQMFLIKQNIYLTAFK